MTRYSKVSLVIICFLFCTRATNTNTAITIIQRNLTVRDGQEASFMCEVPCTHEVFWYVGDIHNSLALPYTDSISELTYSRSFSTCTSSGRYNDTLTLTATSDLDSVAIQCSASMINCDSGDNSCSTIIYSRFRILRVESDVPTPSPSSPSSPFPPSEESSTPCPSPNPVIVTTTETSVSTTVSTSTTTVTSRSTVTQAPEPSECPNVNGMKSDAQKSPSLLSRLQIPAMTVLLCLLTIAVL